MRLSEFSDPPLYLCTDEKLGAGSTAKPNDKRVLSPAIEELLDAKRPLDCLSRSSSIILEPTPRPAQFVYRVEAKRVERFHAGWLERLAVTDPLQDGMMQYLATGYWSGDVCPEARDASWEWRAESAKIICRIGGSNAGPASYLSAKAAII